MKELRKWEPIRDLATIQKEMDEFFRRAFGGLTSGLFGREWSGQWCPDFDCYTRDGKFVVHADIPGVDPKDVDVSVAGNILTVKGERKTDVSKDKGGYIFHESSLGRFERSMTIPEGVELEKVHATYSNGVLELTMPMKEKVLAKKVKVEIGGSKHEEKKGSKAA